MKSSANAQVELYLGVKLAEVDVPKLAAFLLTKGVALGKNDPKSALDAYYAWGRGYRQTGREFVECVNCNAHLPEELEECPVCGDLEDGDLDSRDISESPGVITTTGKSEREIELDQSIERIREHATRFAEEGWKLGKELDRIHREKLYLERRDSKGKPLYKAWDQFCTAEIGVSGMHARNMMLVANRFDEAIVTKMLSDGTFGKVGLTKLGVIAKFDGQDKEILLDMAKNNASLREIMSKANIIRPTPSRSTGSTGSTAGRKKAEAPKINKTEAPSGSKGVTVVFQIGIVELKLEHNKKTGKFEGREDLVNGVVTNYSFDAKRGVLKVERKRED